LGEEGHVYGSMERLTQNAHYRELFFRQMIRRAGRGG